MKFLLPVFALAACTTPLDVRTAPDRTTSPPTHPTDPSTDPTTDPTDPQTDPTPGTTLPDPTGDCPPGVFCVDSFPATHVFTTTGGDSDLDAYACAPSTDESGPEVVYRVTLPADGYLAASVYDLGSGVDVDVHVLSSLDPDDCLDRGHWTAGSLLTAGDWYVVVDSWADGAAMDGDYTLDLGFTPPDAFVADGLSADALDPALFAYDAARRDGITDRLDYVVVDFDTPSTEPRLFAIDLSRGELDLAEVVSHGSGSQDPNDLRMAAGFSNVSGSNASSLGLAIGAETYSGTHGYSLRMDGLDPGFNDNIRDRAVVVHTADYATQAFANTNGYLGRSNGCWAVDPDVGDDLVDFLAEGGLLFTWASEPAFVSGSRWLEGY